METMKGEELREWMVACTISAIGRWQRCQRDLYRGGRWSKDAPVQARADYEVASAARIDAATSAFEYLCKLVEDLAGPAPCYLRLPDGTVVCLVVDTRGYFCEGWARLQIIPGDRGKDLAEPESDVDGDLARRLTGSA